METIVPALVIGIVMLIFGSVYKKYIEPMMPEKKKAILYLKKFLSFNIRYTLNLALLIYFFVTLEFNKSFVLVICIYFSIIIFNVMTDIFFKIMGYSEQIANKHFEMIEKIAKEIDRINGIKN